MAKERRDHKNRILSKGEYQKEDGRYMYRYTDIHGKVKYVYSWTLTSTDRTPKGKNKGPCLRDLEKEIANDLHCNIDSSKAKKNTLNDFFESYMSTKRRLKPTTRRNYRYTYDIFVRDTLGNRKIGDIKYSDVKKFYTDLMYNDGQSLTRIMNIHVFLNPVFKMAEKDNIIRKNPADGIIQELRKECDDIPEKKKALTIEEQNAFIDYVRNHNLFYKWHPMFTFMLGTGCRIGEVCGLTWDDCDFKNNVVRINKTLSYYPDETTGKYRWLILRPKTKSSIREIPMLSDVKHVLQNERIRQMKEGFNTSVVDGVSGFVFCTRSNTVVMPTNVNSVIIRIVDSYNKQETEASMNEGRDPLILPDFSPHILRHTFCTRLCENGVNLKVVQEIMGHSSFRITMDIYNDVSENLKKSAFEQVDGKFKIS